ncbi:MAG: ParB/RepB/Spo0J family partition protein, partial [Eikenella corrodens]|uniref:ParB/RepB/Spo0J family partition protein n=1 Tax=Eikenella corrodens TaxID=539 RepID=UPI0036189631
MALIENIQREDLNPIEEAHAYERLLTEFRLSQEELARRVARSRSASANSVRLLRLAAEV